MREERSCSKLLENVTSQIIENDVKVVGVPLLVADVLSSNQPIQKLDLDTPDNAVPRSSLLTEVTCRCAGFEIKPRKENS